MMSLSSSSSFTHDVLLYTIDFYDPYVNFVGVAEVVLIVYFMDVIGVNVRVVFSILLMLTVNEVFTDCVEHSVRVTNVDEALFKLFDRGVESCYI